MLYGHFSKQLTFSYIVEKILGHANGKIEKTKKGKRHLTSAESTVKLDYEKQSYKTSTPSNVIFT